MFLKKKPGLPKAPDVSQIKDFSLFGASPRSSAEPERERGSQGLASRGLTDVIDVEVVEVPRPAAAPAQSRDAAEAAAHVDEPAPFTAPPPSSAPERNEAARATATRAASQDDNELPPSRPAMRGEQAPPPAAPADAPATEPPQGQAGPKSIKIKARKPGAPLDLTEGEATLSNAQAAPTQAAEPAAEKAKAPWWGGMLPRKDKTEQTPARDAKAVRAEEKSAAEAKAANDDASPSEAKARKPLFGGKTKVAKEPKPAGPLPEAKAKGGWANRFKRSESTPEPEQAPDAKADPENPFAGMTGPSAKKASRGFSWGRKAASSKPGKKAEDKTSEKTSQSKSKSARSDAPRGSTDLLLEMENGRKVYWRVSKQDVQELDESVVRRALSFSRAELRLKTSEALAFGPAQDLVLAELGEDARVVNASRALKSVYAITARRAEELEPVQTAPGLMLLDHLLQDKQVEGQPLLCALVIKGADDAARVAVLVHYTEAGELGALQVTVNPDNLNFVLSQFAASRRLNTEQTQVVLLSNAELLQAVSKVQGYPSEALWRGYSVRKLTWGVTWAAVGIAAACGLYAAKNFTSLQLAQSRIGEAQAQEKKAKASLDALLVSSVKSFAHLQSLDLQQVTERAGEVWTPGSTVMVDAGISTQLYTTQLPLTRGIMQGSRPSVLEQTLPAHVRPLLERAPPQDCAKSLPEISGALNVVQITVTCESTPGPLAAYRLD